MKKRICIALLILLASGANAQSAPAEVMIFGVFHFANPGRDVIRTDQIDVTTPESQFYLDGLAERLCGFRPTIILLEFDPDENDEMRSRLDAYVAGQFELGSNETHQIGFRVAKACEVDKLYGFDESDVGWRGDLLFEYLEDSETELLERLNGEIERLQLVETEAHRELTLRELLVRANSPEEERKNKDLYLLTSAAGAGSGFEGADAAARWWHRNIRMYANIQKYATPGERILVVAGQGHTAILKDLLEIDRRILGSDIRPFL